jgi:hypothetical protein
MGIDNEAVKEHMQSLFGEERAIALRNKLREKSSHQRELLIRETHHAKVHSVMKL